MIEELKEIGRLVGIVIAVWLSIYCEVLCFKNYNSNDKWKRVLSNIIIFMQGFAIIILLVLCWF